VGNVRRQSRSDSVAGTAWCPAAVSFWTTCEPINPVPPMIVSFTSLSFLNAPRSGLAGGSQDRQV
jgi:hypothetical protein